METEQKVFIEVNDKSIECLEYILDKVEIKNIHVYWSIQNIKKDKHGIKAIMQIKKEFDHLVDLEKIQISKIYFLNMVEQYLVDDKETGLNMLLSEIIQTLNEHKTLRESIIYNLCLQDIDSIFDNPELDFEIVNNCSLEKNTKYVELGLNFAQNYNKIKQNQKNLYPTKCKKI